MTSAAMTTGVMTIAVNQYPEKSSVMVSYTESFFGFGSVAAPAFTGPIYDSFGYTAPFIFVGGLLLLFTIALIIILPGNGKTESKKDATEKRKIRLKEVMKLAHLYPGLIGLTVAHMSIAFVLAQLEPHIRFLNYSATNIGGLFLLMGLGYCISSPIFGIFCQKGFSPIHIMMLGQVLLMCGYMLIAPLTVLGNQPTLAMLIAGLLLLGIGSGASKSPSFVHILKVMMEKITFV